MIEAPEIVVETEKKTVTGKLVLISDHMIVYRSNAIAIACD